MRDVTEDTLGEPSRKAGFSFVVTGRLCPNNLVTRHVGNRSVKSARARKDQARVREIAAAAAARAGWRMRAEGEAVELSIISWNPIGDIDGRQKVIMDALGPSYGPGRMDVRELLEEGVVYDNDKRVKSLLLLDDLDWGGPRFEVRVREMDLPQRGNRLRLMRFSDLTEAELQSLAKARIEAEHLLLDPKPGIVQPMLIEFAPKTWTERARKALKEIS